MEGQARKQRCPSQGEERPAFPGDPIPQLAFLFTLRLTSLRHCCIAAFTYTSSLSSRWSKSQSETFWPGSPPYLPIIKLRL